MSHPRYKGPVLDAHCHYDGTTIGRAASVMDRIGLRAAVHFWDLQWPPVRFEDEQREWGGQEPRLYRAHVPDLARVGGRESEASLASELTSAAAAGAVAVKLWKNLGLWLRDTDGRRLAVDDPRLEVVWDTAAANGIPIVIHQGDAPPFFAPLDEGNPRFSELQAHPEWWYGGGEFPPLEQIHEELEAVVSAHPDTRFVGLHFGCFMPWSEVDRMLGEYANYHIDTATTIADMGRDGAWEEVRSVFLRHPDRILFGSDVIRTHGDDLPGIDGGWGVSDTPQRWDLDEFFDRHWRFFETAESGLQHPLPMQGDWTVTGLDLPDDLLYKLYWENGRRVFGLSDLGTEG